MSDRAGYHEWEAVHAEDYMDPVQLYVRNKAADGTRTPIAITRAALQVRRADGSLLLDWATDLESAAPGYGCMVLVDGDAGHCQVGPANMPDEAGVHYYEIEYTLADGRRKTWLAGPWPILAQGNHQ